MNILVTGAGGFLGYHIARHPSFREAHLTLTDIVPFSKEEIPADAELLTADVRDASVLDRIMSARRYHVVIHCAAALPLWKRADIFTTNVEGTRNVLEAAIKHGVERVVYISSTAVYGVPKKHPIEEEDPLVGVGPYGESKIQAETLCNEYRKRGLCIPILRPKTFIGTGRLGVFQILYDWVYDGKRIPIIGSGTNRYQLLEVEDLVDAIWLTCTAPEKQTNTTFNVGAKHFGTVKEDLGALCQYAQTGARVMPTPAWLVKPVLRLFQAAKLSPLYQWVYDTADKDSFVSTTKIESALGWSPKYSNAEALIRSYQWYLDHRALLDGSTGITHRAAWDQGILKVFKRWL